MSFYQARALSRAWISISVITHYAEFEYVCHVPKKKRSRSLVQLSTPFWMHKTRIAQG